MPAESAALLTAEELLDIEIPGKWTELVRGHLVVREPPSTYHGVVSANLAGIVREFVRRHRLGVVCGQDTGFKIRSNPDTVRAPDMGFVARDRTSAIPRHGYAPIAPDLVAEVVSHGDRPGEQLAKVGDWLDAGVRLVWVVDPAREEAHVHRPDGSITILRKGDALDGEDVLPGFRCAIAEILEA